MRIFGKVYNFDVLLGFVFRIETDPVVAMVPAFVEPVPVVPGHPNDVTWKKFKKRFKDESSGFRM